MAFPTRHTVLTEAFTPGAKDPHGNPIDAWAAPAAQRVIGWAPPSSADPKLAGHDRVVVDIELLAPPEFVAGPKDLITLNGKTFSVIGYPEDTDGNPYPWHPGMVVNLQRVEG